MTSTGFAFFLSRVGITSKTHQIVEIILLTMNLIDAPQFCRKSYKRILESITVEKNKSYSGISLGMLMLLMVQ
mgnify:CR=1 FL=1